MLLGRTETTMVTTHKSRIFASGHATTLYVTIPSKIVADSQFPFEPDDEVSITIDGDRLDITAAPTPESG